jgi:hypothetical protein
MGDLATDQLLNAIYLLNRADAPAAGRAELADRIFSYLSEDLVDAELDHDGL